MKPAPSIYSRLVNALVAQGAIKTFKDKPIILDREDNILTHYAREIDLGRMDIISATERAIGDIAGNNRHPKRDQRWGKAKETADAL